MDFHYMEVAHARETTTTMSSFSLQQQRMREDACFRRYMIPFSFSGDFIIQKEIGSSSKYIPKKMPPFGILIGGWF